MARLSNLFGSGDGLAGEAQPIICRPALRAEIEPALRVMLADGTGLAGDDAVLDFLSFAVQRKIDVNSMWIAQHGQRVVWTLLPIVSPGRTMLLLTPGRLPRQTPPQAVRLLAEAVCRHFAEQRVAMAQLLLDPADRGIRDVYCQSGFEPLAELIYLQRTVHRAPEDPALEPGWTLRHYSADTHGVFAETILRSYQASLDCPALNGRRAIEDVIAGHKASGIFDPSMWFVLSERGIGRGVLLLNATSACDSAELIYLGLTPSARGRGIGDALMRLALGTTARHGLRAISLAVDARNSPAIKLYHRHGLKRVGSRVALVRDLRG